MFNLKKIDFKYIVIFLSIFNLMLLISLFFNILVSFGMLQTRLNFLSLIGKYFSTNLILTVSLLIFESLVITYYWYKSKRRPIKGPITENDNTDSILDFEDVDSFENHNTSDDDDFEIESLEMFDTPSDVLNFYKVANNDDTSSHFQSSTSIFETIDEESDFSPSFLSGINENGDTKLFLPSVLEPSAQVKSTSKPILSEQQFALYRNIVKIDWIYERKLDKERIGHDNYSIDESNISYSDLSKLMRCGMIFKRKIHHPRGSFIAYTSNPEIERKIITQFLQRFLRKNKLKMMPRKISFKNWQEFGLCKENWQFDLEITKPAIVACIWCDEAFHPLNDSGGILSEKKEELKALIATATIKLTDGIGILVLNNEANLKRVQKFLKSVAWGELILLNFSDKRFFELFHQVFLRKSLGF